MLRHTCDNRLFNNPLYYLIKEGDQEMQAVPDEIRKCIVFIYYKTQKGDHLCGTGFFISIPFLEDKQRQFIYLVTAKHVIKGIESKTSDCKVYIRLNTKTNSSVSIESNLSDWKFHPTDISIDLAFVPWAPSTDTYDYKTIPISMAVTKEMTNKNQIGAGDEVFLTGLFRHHFGSQRNLPIIRTGNIALMPEERIHTNSFGMIDAYLIEARSIGGLSGSPVFVYLGHVRAVNQNLNLGGHNELFCWLGLMHGHWDIDENDIDAVNENGKNVNMGIGIVVPATKIVETLNCQEFLNERKIIEERDMKENAPTLEL